MSATLNRHDLMAFSPLSELSPDNLQDLISKVKIESVQSGRYIFKKGDIDKKHVYLLSGTVALHNEKKETIKTITAGTPDARQPLGHVQPRSLSARATADATFIRVDSNYLDIMLTWSQTGTYEVEDISSHEDEDDWMAQLLQTKAFHKVPPANIQTIFMRMESVDYKPGDIVIKQGDSGDYFFIIKSGRAMVTRATPTAPKGMKLADLTHGDSFGEEALIAESRRNATVTMLTKGTLMRLSKKDFLELLREPTLNWVSYEEAKEQIKSGKAWLDVRLPTEFQQTNIIGSINIPLILLRVKLKTLDKNKEYIVYCDTGRRSSAAAYLLSEAGISVCALKDGLASVPDEDKNLEGTITS